MDKKIPLYEATLEDEAIGMYTVSLVDCPAMEVEWMALSKKEDIKCSILDDMEHKVLCVICRADFPFPRLMGGEVVNVVFRKETIKQMAQRFLKNGFQNIVNVNHQNNSYLEGVEMEQLFIKDIEKGVNPVAFPQIEDGSLFAVYKVENDEVWEAVKNGTFTGVSLEGNFKMVKEEPKTEEERMEFETIEEMLEWLEKYI